MMPGLWLPPVHTGMVRLGQDALVGESPCQHGAAVTSPAVNYATPIEATPTTQGQRDARGPATPPQCLGHKVTQILGLQTNTLTCPLSFIQRISIL